MKIYSKRSIILRIVLSTFVIIIGVLGFVFKENIEDMITGNSVSALKNADFKMYVVDVGQGDSIYLEFSDNKNMLIDCGKKSESDKIVNFLKEKDVKNISYLVYTHPDEDHIGGGAKVFENFNIEVLYRPKVLSKTENETYGNPNGYNVKDENGKTYDSSIMVAYSEEGCQIRYSFKGEEIVGADYKIKFLNPDQDNYSLSSSNTYSAVLMVEVNGKKVLLTGDAESDVENKLITSYNTYLDADVLKISHHGSKTASTSDFLSYVTPDYALISVGNNQWSMPNEEVLERLNIADVKEVLTTKTGGTITLGIDDNGRITYSQNGKSFKLDMPIFVTVLIVILLLIWGIVIVKKKNKTTPKKKNSKKEAKTI